MSSDTSDTLSASAHPGRVALRVGSLDRVVPFYREVTGLEATREGNQVQLGIDGSALLELQEVPDAPERAPEEAGLFHVAFLYPNRVALADRLARVEASEYELSGASDHNVSEALYLRDPEGNGVELYCDRPREQWPQAEDGTVDIDTLPLDLSDLSRADGERPTNSHKGDDSGDITEGTDADADSETRAPAGTTIGHVHLESIDLARVEGFYVDGLGLRVRARYGEGGTFLAAGEYHHHLGLNSWNARSEPASDGRGLAWFEFVLPGGETLDRVAERLAERGHTVDRGGERTVVTDPDGIELRLGTA